MPTLTFHFCVNSLGQVEGATKPVTLLSRLGPRHWGQSAARRPLAPSRARQTAVARVFVGFGAFMVAPG